MANGEWLSLLDAAERLNMLPAHLLRLCEAGAIEAVLGIGVAIIRSTEVDRILEACRVEYKRVGKA